GGPVLAYRNLCDYREARTRSGPGRRALVVGGGFIGSELAAGLTRDGTRVHMVFQEDAISGLRFPAAIASAVTDDYRERGVTIHARSSVAGADIGEEGVSVALTDGTEERFDMVAVGVGAEPNSALARSSGLMVDDGVVVDEHLRVMRAEPEGGDGTDLGIFAAGDVASFPWPRPFSRGRIEHEDNAVSMGAHAGRQMVASFHAQETDAPRNTAGPKETPYTHLPFFYSDLFDNGYE